MADLTKDLADTVAITDSLVKGVGLNKADTAVINPWYNASWLWRIPITIDHTKVSSSNQTDFPVLINEHDMPASFWTNVKVDGTDIVVTSVDGTTKLKRELVAGSWSRAGETMELYVKVPTLSYTADTVVYLYYGNAAGAETNDTDTWNANFKAVYHMNDDPDTSHIKDSTVNGNDGTKKAANEPVEAAGTIGKAQDFDGDDDYIGCGADGSLDLADTLTLEAVINAGAYISGQEIVLGRHWRFGYNTATSFGFYSIAPFSAGWVTKDPVSRGTDHHVVFTYNTALPNKEAKLYLDGGLATEVDATGDIYDSHNLYIGIRGIANYPFPGIIDEVRISSTDRSAGWVVTTNNTLMSPATFYSVGAVGNADGVVLAFGKPISEVAMGITDALSKEPGLGKADSVTIADSFSREVDFVRTHGDTQAITDALSKEPGLGKVDNVGIADDLSKGVGVSKSDIMTISDVLSKGIGKPEADTQTITDALVKGIGINKADTLAITDTISKAIGVIETETMAMADSLIKAVGVNKVDTVNITDALAKDMSKTLADAIAIIDDLVLTGSYARPGIPIAVFLFQRAITVILVRREITVVSRREV